jgi:hypothetical protein
MLLVLGIVESYNASEPIFAYGNRAVPGEKRGRGKSGATEGSASEVADAGTWRLAQALPGGVITLGADWAAALKVETYRPQPRARFPRELATISTIWIV